MEKVWAVLFVVAFNSCSQKNGEVGPVGPSGKDGISNIQHYQVQVLKSQWTFLYQIQYTDYNDTYHHYKLYFPQFTQRVIDSSVISITYHNGTSIYQLPMPFMPLPSDIKNRFSFVIIKDTLELINITSYWPVDSIAKFRVSISSKD